MANLIIKPTSGGSLILQDEGGDAAVTVGTTGSTTLAGTANNLGTISSATTFPAGHIVKTVVAHKTDTTDINGATATGWFDISGMSASITPANGNKILVNVDLKVGAGNHQQGILMKVLRSIGGASYAEIDYRGNTSDSRSRVIAGFEESGQHATDISYIIYPLNGQFLDSPSTASAITYKVQFRIEHSGSYGFVNRTGNDANNANIPRGASSITLQEIQQ
jgi:hypothetical protein